MDHSLVKLLFISYLVLGANAKVTLTVSDDITVRPTSDSLTDITDDVSITLRCQGSRPDVTFYIRNFVSWTFISATGKQLPLTDGFYYKYTKESEPWIKERQLVLSYKSTGTGYAFYIQIPKVTKSDEGIYRCSLKNENGYIIDSKDVKLTVVNPMQTTEGNLVAESSSTVIPTSPSLPIDEILTTPSQSEPKAPEDLKMKYYRQAIALQKVQMEWFSKASKLVDVLIDQFS